MIVTITAVEDKETKAGKLYKKITGLDPDRNLVSYPIFDTLKDKWALLFNGAVVEFEFVQNGKYQNVKDISSPTLPPPQNPTILPKDKAIINSVPSTLSSEELKLRGVSLSYANDLVKEGIIKITQLYTFASMNVEWMKTLTSKTMELYGELEQELEDTPNAPPEPLQSKSSGTKPKPSGNLSPQEIQALINKIGTTEEGKLELKGVYSKYDIKDGESIADFLARIGTFAKEFAKDIEEVAND